MLKLENAAVFEKRECYGKGDFAIVSKEY